MLRADGGRGTLSCLQRLSSKQPRGGQGVGLRRREGTGGHGRGGGGAGVRHSHFLIVIDPVPENIDLKETAKISPVAPGPAHLPRPRPPPQVLPPETALPLPGPNAGPQVSMGERRGRIAGVPLDSTGGPACTMVLPVDSGAELLPQARNGGPQAGTLGSVSAQPQ